ncbi:rod shape-determining protein [Streptomyces sp. Ncost-T10-10d]|uniref:rod shape-determining protein n=1 Tax=Streptomyces sp. Ncost-T10-10d TaxID=1839774 RepID=UPI00081EDAED|nr:rod shape-determining protein [Streptomyces sp. Ncost-T10-10d]SCF56375.1 rod shape-determining protein MreB [Streptomyces sp. Ncost-T10-10d]
MRSLHNGPRLGRSVRQEYRGVTRGLALDLGSSRTRAWMPGHGVITDTDACGDFGAGPGHGRPVRRGRIVDPVSCGRMLGRIADSALGADRTDTVIVLSHPVLAGSEHRAAARELIAALGPTNIIALDSARAAAACAGPQDGGPLLVVDIGAELTEATLLVDGLVRDARQAETGLTDLDPSEPPTAVVRTVLDMVDEMWKQDRHGAVLGALRKGPLLAGGGAARPDITDRVAVRLGVPVRLADDPATTVVRGAGLILSSVLRRAGATPALPGRTR